MRGGPRDAPAFIGYAPKRSSARSCAARLNSRARMLDCACKNPTPRRKSGEPAGATEGATSSTKRRSPLRVSPPIEPISAPAMNTDPLAQDSDAFARVLGPDEIKRELARNMIHQMGRDPSYATKQDWFYA